MVSALFLTLLAALVAANTAHNATDGGACIARGAAKDLAAPQTAAGTHLHGPYPSVWLTPVWALTTADSVISKVPTHDESVWEPCVGQIDQFDSKRCTNLPVLGDAILEALLERVALQRSARQRLDSRSQ